MYFASTKHFVKPVFRFNIWLIYCLQVFQPEETARLCLLSEICDKIYNVPFIIMFRVQHFNILSMVTLQSYTIYVTLSYVISSCSREKLQFGSYRQQVHIEVYSVHLQLCQYWNIFKKFWFAWLEIWTSNLELPIVWQKFETTFHIQSPICPTPFSSFLRTTPLLLTFFLTTSPNEIRDKYKNNWGKVISSCLEGYIRKNITCFFCTKHL